LGGLLPERWADGARVPRILGAGQFSQSILLPEAVGLDGADHDLRRPVLDRPLLDSLLA
jgi:hypothetical protein